MYIPLLRLPQVSFVPTSAFLTGFSSAQWRIAQNHTSRICGCPLNVKQYN